MTLLKWAIIFFIISLVAGALGFSGLAIGASRIARILFAIFLALAVIFFILVYTVGQAVL